MDFRCSVLQVHPIWPSTARCEAGGPLAADEQIRKQVQGDEAARSPGTCTGRALFTGQPHPCVGSLPPNQEGLVLGEPAQQKTLREIKAWL
jgi:hypothetical protein